MRRIHTITASSQQVLLWHLARTPRRRLVRLISYRHFKRVLDLLLCLVCALPVALVIGLCAILIKLDSPGSIFFYQTRTGKHGRRFRMYKLRTMVANAEALKSTCAYLSHMHPPDFKIANDPRITRVGRILRRTSMDELPQLFNVLRGDMSLVGPRPTSFPPEAYQPWQTARLEVLPGITGLWQISGRARLDFDARVRLDLEYIEHQCIWLDLWIMLCTCGQIVRGDGAY